MRVELCESALFGHEKGSFTGADRRRQGHIERANGGTLVLDEITEMRGDAQAKLLRVIEEKTVPRLAARKRFRSTYDFWRHRIGPWNERSSKDAF